MTAMTDHLGLARVVVLTPRRRLTVALPEQIPVSSLLPGLLRQGGEELAVDGLTTGGWVLRHADGAQLDVTRGLASQGVHDGETLCLVPLHQEWPEPEYDDVVDAIADGARRAQRDWTRAATRTCGLSVTVAAVLLLTGLLVLAPGSGPYATVTALVLAAGLLLAGTLLSRVLGDSGAGAVVAAPAQLVAAAAGPLLVHSGGQPMTGAAAMLVGSALLLLAGVVGLLGVADQRQLFVAGIVAGIGGAAGAGAAMTSVGAAGTAAVVATVLLVLGPAFPLLAVRLAQVPLPSVPRDAADLRAADNGPSFQDTVQRVARATDLLTGLLLGSAVLILGSTAVLAFSAGWAALALAGCLSAAQLLRARILVAARQRVLPLGGGLLGAAVTAAGLALALDPTTRLLVLVPLLVTVAVGAGVSALLHSRRPPTPRTGRSADLLDVLLTLATGPLTATVLGLFPYMRGLAG